MRMMKSRRIKPISMAVSAVFSLTQLAPLTFAQNYLDLPAADDSVPVANLIAHDADWALNRELAPVQQAIEQRIRRLDARELHRTPDVDVSRFFADQVPAYVVQAVQQGLQRIQGLSGVSVIADGTHLRLAYTYLGYPDNPNLERQVVEVVYREVSTASSLAADLRANGGLSGANIGVQLRGTPAGAAQPAGSVTWDDVDQVVADARYLTDEVQLVHQATGPATITVSHIAASEVQQGQPSPRSQTRIIIGPNVSPVEVAAEIAYQSVPQQYYGFRNVVDNLGVLLRARGLLPTIPLYGGGRAGETAVVANPLNQAVHLPFAEGKRLLVAAVPEGAIRRLHDPSGTAPNVIVTKRGGQLWISDPYDARSVVEWEPLRQKEGDFFLVSAVGQITWIRPQGPVATIQDLPQFEARRVVTADELLQAQPSTAAATVRAEGSEAGANIDVALRGGQLQPDSDVTTFEQQLAQGKQTVINDIIDFVVAHPEKRGAVEAMLREQRSKLAEATLQRLQAISATASPRQRALAPGGEAGDNIGTLLRGPLQAPETGGDAIGGAGQGAARAGGTSRVVAQSRLQQFESRLRQGDRTVIDGQEGLRDFWRGIQSPEQHQELDALINMLDGLVAESVLLAQEALTTLGAYARLLSLGVTADQLSIFGPEVREIIAAAVLGEMTKEQALDALKSAMTLEADEGERPEITSAQELIEASDDLAKALKLRPEPATTQRAARQQPKAGVNMLLEVSERLGDAAQRRQLMSAAGLDQLEQQTIELLYSRHDLSAEQVGQVLGISAEQVMQIEYAAYDKIWLHLFGVLPPTSAAGTVGVSQSRQTPGGIGPSDATTGKGSLGEGFEAVLRYFHGRSFTARDLQQHRHNPNTSDLFSITTVRDRELDGLVQLGLLTVNTEGRAYRYELAGPIRNLSPPQQQVLLAQLRQELPVLNRFELNIGPAELAALQQRVQGLLAQIPLPSATPQTQPLTPEIEEALRQVEAVQQARFSLDIIAETVPNTETQTQIRAALQSFQQAVNDIMQAAQASGTTPAQHDLAVRLTRLVPTQLLQELVSEVNHFADQVAARLQELQTNTLETTEEAGRVTATAHALLTVTERLRGQLDALTIELLTPTTATVTAPAAELRRVEGALGSVVGAAGWDGATQQRAIAAFQEILQETPLHPAQWPTVSALTAEDVNALQQLVSVAAQKNNIALTERLINDDQTPQVIGIVSGSQEAQAFWQRLLDQTKVIFHAAEARSLHEDLPVNQAFGILLAWQRLQTKIGTLIAFVFGTGSRSTPFTETDAAQKPAILTFARTRSASGETRYLSMVELAMKYFIPVQQYLQRSGFDGLVVKWGDEVLIPTTDLSKRNPLFEGADVVRFVSMTEMNNDQALQKDWVGVDESGRVTAFIPRRPLSEMEQLADRGLLQRRDGKLYGGVNHGSIAISQQLLDALLTEFAREVNDANANYSDRPALDPEFFTALTIALINDAAEREQAWQSAVNESRDVKKLSDKMPNILSRLRGVVEQFERDNGRRIKMVAMEFQMPYWGDIGLHPQMYEFYMALNTPGPAGEVARAIAQIPRERDANGNIIVDSTVAPSVAVRNSVLIGVNLEGSGTVEGAVLIGTHAGNVNVREGFDVGSTVPELTIEPRGGTYRVVQRQPVVAHSSERLTTLFLPEGEPQLFRVQENTNLRDTATNYDVPILGNPLSFREAHARMGRMTMERLQHARAEREREVASRIARGAGGGAAGQGVVAGTGAGAAAPIPTPTFLNYQPRELRFGTSGLRDAVVNMTDIEVYINTRGYLDYLAAVGDVQPGEPVAIAGDLRTIDPTTGLSSTPRITRAVARAIRDAGYQVANFGNIPTPALAYYAMQHGMIGIVITGSHIPADLNGVKFYKKSGEVLKDDEQGILTGVRRVRVVEYGKTAEQTLFAANGMFKEEQSLEPVNRTAEREYVHRYLDLFEGQTPLAGQRIVVYEHSAVGRDLLVEILQSLGADVIRVDRSDIFVPIDTEDVKPEDGVRFRGFAETYHPDAIVSTDGDSDRPFVVDEHGTFHRGDVLGAVVAEFVGARFAAVPISASDAVERHLSEHDVRQADTMIGSPFVIKAMNDAIEAGVPNVVGWEVNGGFLTATDVTINGHMLASLPTRDAMLPILAALLTATRRGQPLSQVMAEAAHSRFTDASLVDHFPTESSRAIVTHFLPSDRTITDVRFEASGALRLLRADGSTETLPVADARVAEFQNRRQELEHYFSAAEGFGAIVRINFLDGVRIFFDSQDVAHMRPSGNAPQFRIYSASNSQERAGRIVALAISEETRGGQPAGIYRQMERDIVLGGGNGTAVPSATPPGGMSEEDRERQHVRAAASSAIPVQVLVVAPHDIAREGLREILERSYKMGVVVTTAASTEEAQQSLASRPFDVVIVRMPDDAEGFSLVQTIRSSNPAVHPVLLSAWGPGQLARALEGASIEREAITVVEKDSTLNVLLNALNPLLQSPSGTPPGSIGGTVVNAPSPRAQQLVELARAGGHATVADAIRAQDGDVLGFIAAGPITPVKTNFVERPWGGMRMREYKGLNPMPDQKRLTGQGLGEAFEISSYRTDQEAREHPSIVRFADGSEIDLPSLLDAAGERILGQSFVDAYGREIPLLPKTLDIQELLSVQGHPEGNTEVYVVIDAEPGATIRLGFRQNIADVNGLKTDLQAGRDLQAQFLGQFVRPDANQSALYDVLNRNFGERQRPVDAVLLGEISSFLVDGVDARAAIQQLQALKDLYWRVLDLLNPLEVKAGQVIYNANPPEAVQRRGRQRSAEVHALGNPGGKEVLALEIRRPGVTYRAWDNVRFPVRPIQLNEVFEAFNLSATTPGDFIVTPQQVQPGVFRSVESETFVIDHLRPTPNLRVGQSTDGAPQFLFVIKGAVQVRSSNGELMETLGRGESTIIPASVNGYELSTDDQEVEVVRVTIPLPAKNNDATSTSTAAARPVAVVATTLATPGADQVGIEAPGEAFYSAKVEALGLAGDAHIVRGGQVEQFPEAAEATLTPEVAEFMANLTGVIAIHASTFRESDELPVEFRRLKTQSDLVVSEELDDTTWDALPATVRQQFASKEALRSRLGLRFALVMDGARTNEEAQQRAAEFFQRNRTASRVAADALNAADFVAILPADTEDGALAELPKTTVPGGHIVRVIGPEDWVKGTLIPAGVSALAFRPSQNDNEATRTGHLLLAAVEGAAAATVGEWVTFLRRHKVADEAGLAISFDAVPVVSQETRDYRKTMNAASISG